MFAKDFCSTPKSELFLFQEGLKKIRKYLQQLCFLFFFCFCFSSVLCVFFVPCVKVENFRCVAERVTGDEGGGGKRCSRWMITCRKNFEIWLILMVSYVQSIYIHSEVLFYFIFFILILCVCVYVYIYICVFCHCLTVISHNTINTVKIPL